MAFCLFALAERAEPRHVGGREGRQQGVPDGRGAGRGPGDQGECVLLPRE